MIFPLANATAPVRTRVKICGLTNPEDTALAIALGADAIGLNFYRASPRCLDLAGELAWLRGLPAGVRRVGVLVNPSIDDIRRLWDDGLVDAFQLHGDETGTFCASLAEQGIPFAKAIRVRDAASLDRPEQFHSSEFVLDAFQPGAYGGTGKIVDWELARQFAVQQRAVDRRVILSGGLQPENVAGAIRNVRPFGVDVASGVEGPADPRRKDPERLRKFFAAVHAADSADAES